MDCATSMIYHLLLCFGNLNIEFGYYFYLFESKVKVQTVPSVFAGIRDKLAPGEKSRAPFAP